MIKRLAVFILSISMMTLFVGCNDDNKDDIIITPADQIDFTTATTISQEDYIIGDVALDITKLETGNLQSGGIYYASYGNTFFFNYFLDEPESTTGQCTLYAKDSFGVITPVGSMNISFEIPNYPQGLYYANNTIYYTIPSGVGSGIYQISPDGSNNRIVVQTDTDLVISRIDYTSDKIFYTISSSTEDDDRAGIYFVDMFTGITTKIDINANGIFTRDSNNNFYYQNPENKSEIIISNLGFEKISSFNIETDEDISKMLVYDNYIYYYTTDKSLARTEIATGISNTIIENYDISSFLVIETMIFFTGTDDEASKPNHQLHTIDPDGEFHTVLTVEHADSIMSDGDWIYAYVTQGESYVPGYRIRVDGTDYESSVIVG